MTAPKETPALFRMALGVMNESLDANRDKMPYKQIFDACEKVLGGRNIGVAVYSDDPDTPHDYFTLRFQDGKFDVVKHGKDAPEVAWKVARSYLQRVVEHPEEYVNNPAKLDWDWLKTRLGVSPR